MSVSINKVVEELSKREPGAAKPATVSLAVMRQLEQESNSSEKSEKPLSIVEQTAALSTRYAEAGLSVSVNFQTVDGHLVYVVKDSRTGDVIRQIPSEEALRIAKHLDRLTGVMLDKSVE
ncbi:MAG: flagellar protein FlaG [Gammaproteobacteria bacterium]|nr:flagellar protein FlaG [Gammaproteobacteria bacterium]MBM4231886.1 flagellar protein FlaG [Gammaproteobacteria bacterium]